MNFFHIENGFSDPHFNVTFQHSYQARQYSDATNTESTPTAVDGAVTVQLTL